MHYDPILCMNVPDVTRDSKTIDSIKEYEFHYTVPNDKRTMVGSGRGATEEEAKADFMKTHKSENPTITMSKLYKTIDKAIRMCDEGKYYEFTFSDGSKYYGTESDLGEFTSHLNKEEKKEFGSVKSKKEMTKEQVKQWRNKAMSKLGL